MRNATFPFGAIACTALLALTALGAEPRDPFWPIGFDPNPPPPPKKQEPPPALVAAAPAEVAKKPKEAAPAPDKISPEEWSAAEKTMKPSGFWKAGTTAKVMINRKIYAVGDELVATNNNVKFIWRVQSLEKNKLTLTGINAARVK